MDLCTARARHHPDLAVRPGGARPLREPRVVPWTHALISGFVVDPDRKKMSKSKGNVIVPTDILEKYGADAVRWRAAMARPGLDSPFDETQMKVGRRLAMKVLNASKFALAGVGARPSTRRGHRAGRPWRCWPASRDRCGARPTAFEAYDYTTALEVTERFFWTFCDDYVELVKERAYGARGEAAAASAKAALALALHVQLRLLAPFLPYVTEEVWSWWQDGSVHRAAVADRRRAAGAEGADPAMLDAVSRRARRAARRQVEREGLDAHRAQTSATISAPRALVDLLARAAEDLRRGRQGGRRAGLRRDRRRHPGRRRADRRRGARRPAHLTFSSPVDPPVDSRSTRP